MKKNNILIVLMLITSQTFGQVDPVGQFNKHIVENWRGEYVRISQYRVKGTPYLLGESFPGSIKYKEGKPNDKGKILYNLYEQKAGIDLNSQIYEPGETIEEFTINLPEKFGGKTLLFRNSEVFGNVTLKSYFNVIEDGAKTSFLKIFKIKLVSDPSNMFDKDLKIFEQYYEYYLYNKNTRDLSKIKLKEKEVIKQLGKEEFIKGFISKNELEVSKESDMIKLIQAYNNN